MFLPLSNSHVGCLRKIQIYPKGQSSNIGTHFSLHLTLMDPNVKIYAEYHLGSSKGETQSFNI